MAWYWLIRLYMFQVYISMIHVHHPKCDQHYFLFFNLHSVLCLFTLERGKGLGGWREREILVASRTLPNGELKLQPRHVPWPGSNPQPFGVGRMLQPNELPGHGKAIFLNHSCSAVLFIPQILISQGINKLGYTEKIHISIGW